MSKKTYYVQSGNWCLRLNLNPKEFDNLDDTYMELGTRSIETIFGNKEFEDPDDDYYLVTDDDGNNVLNDDVDLPIPTFTIDTHIMSSKNDGPYKLLATVKTSQLFANAAQDENFKFACGIEKKETKNKKKDK